ncbi:unnamed protein product, partial [Larinioides sclopetarius]
MDKEEKEDAGKKGKETPQQQEKSQDAPSPEQSTTPQQQSQMQGYQGANQMPLPQYQGQPVPYYPPALPHNQGRPFDLKTKDNDKEPRSDEQQLRNFQNFSYPLQPPPYPQPQMQPYGYPGSSQMPQYPQYQISS